MTSALHIESLISKADIQLHIDKSKFVNSDNFDKYVVLSFRSSLDLDDVVTVSIYSESEYDDQGGSYDLFRMSDMQLMNGIMIRSDHSYELPNDMTEQEAFEYLKDAMNLVEDEDMSDAVYYICDIARDFFTYEMNFYDAEFIDRTFQYYGPTEERPSRLESSMAYMMKLLRDSEKELRKVVDENLIFDHILSSLVKEYGAHFVKNINTLTLEGKDSGGYTVTDVSFTNGHPFYITLEMINDVISSLNFFGVDSYLSKTLILPAKKQK